MDACDLVMDKIGKPRGLVRFSSQARVGGEQGRLVRPRVILYPTIMAVLLTAFLVVLIGKEPADITLLRGYGQPFTEITPGEITNQVRVKIKNRTDAPAQYTVTVSEHDPAKLTATQNPISVAAGDARTEVVLVTVPKSAFRDGKLPVTLRISDGESFSKEVQWLLLGPY
jgi:polyferredoxin